MGKIDDTDMKILTELVKDAGLSVPKLSKKINVNPSVVYSRIKRLLKRGLIKRFTVEVDEELLGYGVAALIGINIDAKAREKILDELKSLRSIRQIVEVTGRFDILLDTRAKSLDDLHEVVSNKIARVVGILHTETFIEMQRESIEPEFFLPR